jgi:hypothetical protein
MHHRRPGRPPLDSTDPSTKVCVALPSRRYDAVYRQAAAARVSVPELIRQSLNQILVYPKSPERDRRR